jgi:hypothetical protein
VYKNKKLKKKKETELYKSLMVKKIGVKKKDSTMSLVIEPSPPIQKEVALSETNTNKSCFGDYNFMKL